MQYFFVLLNIYYLPDQNKIQNKTREEPKSHICLVISQITIKSLGYTVKTIQILENKSPF